MARMRWEPRDPDDAVDNANVLFAVFMVLAVWLVFGQ